MFTMVTEFPKALNRPWYSRKAARAAPLILYLGVKTYYGYPFELRCAAKPWAKMAHEDFASPHDGKLRLRRKFHKVHPSATAQALACVRAPLAHSGILFLINEVSMSYVI